MFIVEKTGNVVVSSDGSQSNPINQVLDSSPEQPDPGTPAPLTLHLDSSQLCRAATISVEGEGAKFWQLIDSDPSTQIDPAWLQTITINVPVNTKVPFWCRALTDHTENSQNDTRPKLKVTGKIES